MTILTEVVSISHRLHGLHRFSLLDSSVMICGICGTFHADVLISHGFHGLHRFSFD